MMYPADYFLASRRRQLAGMAMAPETTVQLQEHTMPKSNPDVENVAEIVGGHLDEILRLFKKPAKITVLVRRPEHADGSQIFILTDDKIDEAIAALLRHKHDAGRAGK